MKAMKIEGNFAKKEMSKLAQARKYAIEDARKATKLMKAMKKQIDGWVEVCPVTGIHWHYDGDEEGIDRGYMDDLSPASYYSDRSD